MFHVKNVVLFVLIFSLIFCVLYVFMIYFWPYIFGRTVLWKGYKVERIRIEGKQLRLILATDPKQWSQGLMYLKKKPDDYDGMIFLFGSAAPRTFWNMNTYVDLKLYWMRDGRIIGTSSLPSITT